jgi:hypothetical protein
MSITCLSKCTVNFVVYTALLANPSTGKSTAQSMVKDAMTACEEFDQTRADESKLSNDKFILLL